MLTERKSVKQCVGEIVAFVFDLATGDPDRFIRIAVAVLNFLRHVSSDRGEEWLLAYSSTSIGIRTNHPPVKNRFSTEDDFIYPGNQTARCFQDCLYELKATGTQLGCVHQDFRAEIVLVSTPRKVQVFSLSDPPVQKRQVAEEFGVQQHSPFGLILSLISAQPKGEDGRLLNDGRDNIFIFGLRLVVVFFDQKHYEWKIACSVAYDREHKLRYEHGHQVFIIPD
ncbi:MAG: hypothetical protein NTY66_03365 [Candidatus Vogelbacteria bacterium]|nr:hypothetical protein [Candidatus Vogelbacteria bacterium]